MPWIAVVPPSPRHPHDRHQACYRDAHSPSGGLVEAGEVDLARPWARPGGVHHRRAVAGLEGAASRARPPGAVTTGTVM